MNPFTRAVTVAAAIMQGLAEAFRKHPRLAIALGAVLWGAGSWVLLGDPHTPAAWFWGIWMVAAGLVLLLTASES